MFSFISGTSPSILSHFTKTYGLLFNYIFMKVVEINFFKLYSFHYFTYFITYYKLFILFYDFIFIRKFVTKYLKMNIFYNNYILHIQIINCKSNITTNNLVTIKMLTVF
jgi:hypothetical protein